MPPPQTLRLSDSPAGSALVLQVEGELDAFTVPRFAERLAGTITSGNVDVVIDLAGVSFIDSAGLSALLNGVRRATHRGGSLVLAAPSERVKRVLEVTGLAGTFGLYATVDAALAELPAA